jgi:hypothetical protein
MLLEVHERMQLVSLMPVEGGYEALKTMRRQREMLSLMPEEMKILDYKEEKLPNGNTKVHWDVNKTSKVVKDVPVDEYMTNFFRKKLSELEAEGKLTEQTMSLYEKFVIMYK